MSALLSALQRLEGRAKSPAPVETAPFAPQYVPEPTPTYVAEPAPAPAWDEVTLPVETSTASPVVAESDEGAAALVRLLPAPALATVMSIGLSGDLPPLVRRFGEALSAHTATDVVMLGPGTLDDAAGLAAQWDALRSHVGYGLVHAPAARALLHFDALRQTAGVIAVIELGRTSGDELRTIRALLADRGVPLLGVLAVRDA